MLFEKRSLFITPIDSINFKSQSMKKKLFDFLKPPDYWKVPVILILGIFIGLGIYVFYVSRAYSYLSDDPKTCVNCHLMAPQYATWSHSAHREVATCTACHVPLV